MTKSKRATKTDVFVGCRIRAVRKDLGLSQSTIAGMLDVTFQQIQKYENGMNRISAGRLYELATALKLPITEFLPK